MFKKIALSGLVLSFLSVPLFAQQTATPDAPARTNQANTNTRMGKNRSMQQHAMGDPATRAKKMTDRMTQQLGLDQTTSQKVYDVMLTRAQKIDAIQASSDNNRTKAQSLKANADEVNAQLKGILTPDQFTKLESMKGHRHGGRRGQDSDANDKDQK